jgi:DNA-binding NarL/FixJ family response regulator
MTVLFADDHFLVLEGLRDLLHKKNQNASVLLASNKSELFDQLKSKKPDLLIQDLKFGSDNAVEFIDDIYLLSPQIKILIFTSISDPSTINAMAKKTEGYILKTDPVETILEGIANVLQGEKYISPNAKKIANALINLNKEVHFTKRELDVIREIMKEIPIKTIAKNLQISDKTVEMHRSNIFLKLEVNNITGLVKKVIALGILD